MTTPNGSASSNTNMSNHIFPPPFDPINSTSRWSNNIWANPSTSSSSYRDAVGTTTSRGSDQLSPTAPSGSAQLNPHSEPAPWASSGRSSIAWHQRRTSPSSISPTHEENQLPYGSHGSNNNSNTFPLRHSISQDTSTRNNRTVAPGPVDSPTSTSRYTSTIGGPQGEERASSGMYGATGTSQHGLNITSMDRRSSADPGFLGVGLNRPGALSNRQPETNGSGLASQGVEPVAFPETPQFSIRAMHTNSRSSRGNSRISLAPEPTHGQAPSFPNGSTHAGLEQSLDITLRLEDTREPFSTTLPYSFSTIQQGTWHPRTTNGMRSFGNGTPPEPRYEQQTTSYRGVQRSSVVERSSPTDGSHRSHLNSPGNSAGTPNQQTDPWIRPVLQNASMTPDLDRQQQGPQYPHQSLPPYSQYFNPSWQPQPQYEQYPQMTYRSSMSPAGYTQYIPVPIRPDQNSDPTQGVRSTLLEEFRNLHRTNRRYELKDIYGFVVEFSGDQHGSRFIQDKLVVANSEEKDRVFNEIVPNALQLMKDVFGNYVIQKFFEHGNQPQKKLLASAMKSQVGQLSLQMYSCRVAIEHVLLDQQLQIVDELRPNIVSIASDPHGNHVVQKVIEMFPRRSMPFIMEAFRGQIDHLAAQAYACRVIQRMLEHGTPDEKKRLLVEIHACTTKLMTDQFGNYVIQHVITHGEPGDRAVMIQQVIAKTLTLSKHKFASNVVEKCIVHGTEDDARAIRSKLTTPGSDGTSPLQFMIRDQYGNYVVQKLLGHLKGQEKIDFALELKAHIPQLKKQGNQRQNQAVERLSQAIEPVLNLSTSPNINGDVHTATTETPSGISTSIGINGCVATAATAPSTPNLAVEVSSAVPTPPPTTEQNSPQSCSPPSTNISTVDEASEEKTTASDSQPGKGEVPVNVQET
ncbi:hypothetical protein NUW58_g5250 [Xylaria curta]|uniref:Uncharacterized protein n=1 Tax=Xylaria curta TaxID=42375 RepID=A0ACC1P393_9PEZI|nr:hypothetical protein NUW58_g5250 [Xylaria curta]